jgi:hypothetical protein
MIYFLKKKKGGRGEGEKGLYLFCFCYKRLLTVPIMPKEVAINNKR